MRHLKSKRLLLAGSIILLVVVGLLSFGERARRGHYHFDGGRGWDFAPAATLDTGHVKLHPVVVRPAAIMFESQERPVHTPLSPQIIPAPKNLRLDTLHRLRPPPLT